MASIDFARVIEKDEITDEEFNAVISYVKSLSQKLKNGNKLVDEPTRWEICDIEIGEIVREPWFATPVTLISCDGKEYKTTIDWVLWRIFIMGYLHEEGN